MSKTQVLDSSQPHIDPLGKLLFFCAIPEVVTVVVDGNSIGMWFFISFREVNFVGGVWSQR